LRAGVRLLEIRFLIWTTAGATVKDAIALAELIVTPLSIVLVPGVADVVEESPLNEPFLFPTLLLPVKEPCQFLSSLYSFSSSQVELWFRRSMIVASETALLEIFFFDVTLGEAGADVEALREESSVTVQCRLFTVTVWTSILKKNGKEVKYSIELGQIKQCTALSSFCMISGLRVKGIVK